MSKRRNLLGELTKRDAQRRARFSLLINDKIGSLFLSLTTALVISEPAFANGRYQQNIGSEPVKAERILCVNASGRSWKVGTATVLGHNTRLTAHHVVEDCKIIYIGNKSFKVAYTDPSIDLAVLGFGRDFRKLNCDAVPRGQQVMLKGYPEGAQQQVVSQGKTSRSGRGRFASVEGFAVKGMSGGPVTEKSGRLAGIFQAYKGTSRYWYVPGPSICASLQNLPGAMIPRDPFMKSAPQHSLPVEYPKIVQADENLQVAPEALRTERSQDASPILVADASGSIPALPQRQQIFVSAHSSDQLMHGTNVQDHSLIHDKFKGKNVPEIESLNSSLATVVSSNEYLPPKIVDNVNLKAADVGHGFAQMSSKPELSVLEKSALARGLTQIKSEKNVKSTTVEITVKAPLKAKVKTVQVVKKVAALDSGLSNLGEKERLPSKKKIANIEKRKGVNVNVNLDSIVKGSGVDGSGQLTQKTMEPYSSPNCVKGVKGMTNGWANDTKVSYFGKTIFRGLIQTFSVKVGAILPFLYDKNRLQGYGCPRPNNVEDKHVVSVLVSTESDRDALQQFIKDRGLRVMTAAANEAPEEELLKR